MYGVPSTTAARGSTAKPVRYCRRFGKGCMDNHLDISQGKPAPSGRISSDGASFEGQCCNFSHFWWDGLRHASTIGLACHSLAVQPAHEVGAFKAAWHKIRPESEVG